MRDDPFDRLLMEDVEWLPPEPDPAYTPWRRAVTQILWGLFLLTVHFNFLYLQYLLPFLGSMLLYLGLRTLRRENRWFRLCRALAAGLLVWHMVYLTGLASPAVRLLENGALVRVLTVLNVGANLLLMAALRQGVRRAFSTLEGEPPPDLLGVGLLAYLGALAIALWSELVPLTRMSEGPLSFLEITNKPLYYGRSIAFLALHILLLWCIYRQGRALEGRGYGVTPAPVRVSGGLFVLLCALLTAAVLLPVLRFTPRAAAPVAAVLTASGGEEGRGALIELGMDAVLAAELPQEELDLCAEALAVERLSAGHFYGLDPSEGGAPTYELDGGRLSLGCQAVVLPSGRVRYYYTWQWTKPPKLRLQESVTGYVSSRYPSGDYAARRYWPEGGAVWSAASPLILGGGQTAAELPEWALEWYSGELEFLGHLRSIPGTVFSLPEAGDAGGGWIAWTEDMGTALEEGDESVWLSADGIYRHQYQWLAYPFYDMRTIAATGSIGNQAPLYGFGCRFEKNIPNPWED